MRGRRGRIMTVHSRGPAAPSSTEWRQLRVLVPSSCTGSREVRVTFIGRSSGLLVQRWASDAKRRAEPCLPRPDADRPRPRAYGIGRALRPTRRLAGVAAVAGRPGRQRAKRGLVASARARRSDASRQSPKASC